VRHIAELPVRAKKGAQRLRKPHCGCTLSAAQRCAAHAPRNAVSAAYNHALYLEPRAKMVQAWADYLERTQRGGAVLPFRRSAA
jgi:hypothetical protein